AIAAAIAGIDRGGKVCAAMVIDAGHRHVEHAAQRLLGAIVGMLMPRDVAEQRRGAAEAALLLVLIGEERRGPGEQLVAVGAEAAVQRGRIGAAGDERVGTLLVAAEQAVEMPLAQAEGGEDELLGR